MRTVQWTTEAKRQRLEWLIWLAERDEALAQSAFEATVRASDELALRPFAFRQARWAGLRERSVRRWRKIIVFHVADEAVTVVAFYDMRRDLTRLSPSLEA